MELTVCTYLVPTWGWCMESAGLPEPAGAGQQQWVLARSDAAGNSCKSGLSESTDYGTRETLRCQGKRSKHEHTGETCSEGCTKWETVVKGTIDSYYWPEMCLLFSAQLRISPQLYEQVGVAESGMMFTQTRDLRVRIQLYVWLHPLLKAQLCFCSLTWEMGSRVPFSQEYCEDWVSGYSEECEH